MREAVKAWTIFRRRLWCIFFDEAPERFRIRRIRRADKIE